MICPACKSHMIVVEHEHIELDYCTSCKGVWFDSGELELLLERLGLRASRDFLSSILVAGTSTNEKKRRCPLCRRRMVKTSAGQNPAVLVDVCPQEDGIWFDGGEVGQLVQKLPAQAGTDDGQKVMAFLGNTFKCHDSKLPGDGGGQ